MERTARAQNLCRDPRSDEQAGAQGRAPEVAKGTLEVAGKPATAPSDPVVDQYRRKLSMALF